MSAPLRGISRSVSATEVRDVIKFLRTASGDFDIEYLFSIDR